MPLLQNTTVQNATRRQEDVGKINNHTSAKKGIAILKPVKPWIVGNWKMHGSRQMIAEYLPVFLDGWQKSGDLAERVHVGICPPFPYLGEMANLLASYPVHAGAQNVNQHPDGFYTGEVSASMLSDLGITLCLVGHSERRHGYGESNSLVGEKVKILLETGINPLVCIGETQAQRDAEDHQGVVDAQLESALRDLPAGAAGQILIGYEPVWAIGTGVNATPEQAGEMHAHIRGWLNGRFGSGEGATIPILYGGSVTPDNAQALLSQPEVNGALVGGSSLKPDLLISILQQALS